MNNQRSINKMIESLVGEPERYDLRREFQIIESDLSYEEANARYDSLPDDTHHLYAITSSIPLEYCSDLNLAVSVAKRVADKNNRTFVLSLEDNEWRAAFGDYGDCAEFRGSSPAYCTCMSILKFHGKL